MSVSRRTFMKTAGTGGVAAFLTPVIGARGSEALRPWLDQPITVANHESIEFAADVRAAARRGLASGIRLDSNENPNGPGKVALDAVTAMFGEASRYADAPMDDIVAAIAKEHGVTPAN